MSKLDFSAIHGHVEHESAPEVTATPVLDFSAIHGHIQHSDSVVPEATTLGKPRKMCRAFFVKTRKPRDNNPQQCLGNRCIPLKNDFRNDG